LNIFGLQVRVFSQTLFFFQAVISVGLTEFRELRPQLNLYNLCFSKKLYRIS
jgi:hypothetical protein